MARDLTKLPSVCTQCMKNIDLVEFNRRRALKLFPIKHECGRVLYDPRTGVVAGNGGAQAASGTSPGGASSGAPVLRPPQREEEAVPDTPAPVKPGQYVRSRLDGREGVVRNVKWSSVSGWHADVEFDDGTWVMQVGALRLNARVPRPARRNFSGHNGQAVNEGRVRRPFRERVRRGRAS